MCDSEKCMEVTRGGLLNRSVGNSIVHLFRWFGFLSVRQILSGWVVALVRLGILGFSLSG
ncbi:unnamed protein product [Arabidopsis halleri]